MTVETHLDPVKDAMGRSTFGYRISNHIDIRSLAANVAEGHTIPSGAKHCLIRSEVDIWVDPASTAAVPSGDVTDGSAAYYIPADVLEPIEVDDVTTLSIISEYAGLVMLAFYK